MMDIEEYPLLHYPDLMHTVLLVAAEGQGTLDGAAARVRRNLELARESPPISAAEMRERLERSRRYLAAARLIAPEDGEPFQATARGRQVLADHPGGVDDSVLSSFPEFRAFIEARSGSRPGDAQDTAYDEGFTAYRRGTQPSDNPYAFDTEAHLAWENGWFEARDEDPAAAGGPRQG